MDPMILIVVLIALAGFGAVSLGAAVFFFQRYASPEPSVIQQRLSRIKEQKDLLDTPEAAQLSRVSRLYKSAEYKDEKMGKRLEKLDFFRSLKTLLNQADVKTPADKYFLSYMVLPLVVCTMLGLLSKFVPLLLIGPAAAAGAYFRLIMKRNARLAKFTALMPDTLSMICSALRAGHSFQSALTVVSIEMPDPVATEFTNVVRDINLGIPVKEALNRMVSKLNSLPDVRMFATAVMIQREAGGNLAEVLEKLGYTIRERFKLKGQIAALTGQARMTGYVLGAAPAGILAFMSVFMYGYVQPLYETDIGKGLLVLIVFLQLIGFTIMKKIVDIRV